MDNYDYLQDIVKELIEDDEWEFPKEYRFFLMGGLCEQLLFQ